MLKRTCGGARFHRFSYPTWTPSWCSTPNGNPVVNYGVTTIIIGELRRLLRAGAPESRAAPGTGSISYGAFLDKIRRRQGLEMEIPFGDYLNYIEGKIAVNVGPL